jgi:hypothetical protein
VEVVIHAYIRIVGDAIIIRNAIPIFVIYSAAFFRRIMLPITVFRKLLNFGSAFSEVVGVIISHAEIMSLIKFRPGLGLPWMTLGRVDYYDITVEDITVDRLFPFNVVRPLAKTVATSVEVAVFPVPSGLNVDTVILRINT